MSALSTSFLLKNVFFLISGACMCLGATVLGPVISNWAPTSEMGASTELMCQTPDFVTSPPRIVSTPLEGVVGVIRTMMLL